MTNRFNRAASMVWLAVNASLFLPSSAFAALGGAPMPPPPGSTSTLVDPTQHTATLPASGGTVAFAARPAQATAPYSIKETKLTDGTVVREFLSGPDTVFAVSWSGPRIPNLSTLLGQYAAQYTQRVDALRSTHPGIGPIPVEEPGLVVRSAGHMGSFKGQAWIPQALPAGVTASDIR